MGAPCQTKRIPPSSSGSARMRLPVSAKTAFAIAGATSGTPASPIPPGVSPHGPAVKFERGQKRASLIVWGLRIEIC